MSSSPHFFHALAKLFKLAFKNRDTVELMWKPSRLCLAFSQDPGKMKSMILLSSQRKNSKRESDQVIISRPASISSLRRSAQPGGARSFSSRSLLQLCGSTENSCAHKPLQIIPRSNFGTDHTVEALHSHSARCSCRSYLKSCKAENAWSCIARRSNLARKEHQGP